MTTQKTKRHMNKPIITPLKEVLERRLACRMSDYVFPVAAMRHAQADNTTGKLSIDFTTLLKQFGFIEATTNVLPGNRRKVSSLSFHSLRATTVTALRLAGVPADLCRVIVGHRSELIERVYFRPDEKDIAKAMEKLTLEPIPSVVEA